MSGRPTAALTVAAAALLLTAGCTAHGTPSVGSSTTGSSTTGSPPVGPAPSAEATGSSGPEQPGSPPAPGGAPSRPAGTPGGGSGGGITRCHTGQLRGQTVPSPDSGGSGQRYALLGLTNTGVACRIYGYPGMQARDADQRNLPTRVLRDAQPAPTTFVLGHGKTAWTRLHWTVVPASDEPGALCEPPTASLWVTPPDETSQLSVSAPLGPICQHNEIHVSALSLKREF